MPPSGRILMRRKVSFLCVVVLLIKWHSGYSFRVARPAARRRGSQRRNWMASADELKRTRRSERLLWPALACSRARAVLVVAPPAGTATPILELLRTAQQPDSSLRRLRHRSYASKAPAAAALAQPRMSSEALRRLAVRRKLPNTTSRTLATSASQQRRR